MYSQTNIIRSTQKFIVEQTLNAQTKVYSRTNIEHCTLKQIVYSQTNIVGTNKKFTVKHTLYAQTKSLPVTNTEAHTIHTVYYTTVKQKF